MAEIRLDIQIDNEPVERLTNSLDNLTDTLSDVEKASQKTNKEIVSGTDKATKSVKEANKETRIQSDLMSKLGPNSQNTLKAMQQGWKGTTTATKMFGVALKATGIGLLIAIMAPIIDAFKNFVGQLDIVKMYLELIGAVLDIVSKALNTLTGLIFRNRKATDDLIKSNKELQDQRDNNWAKQEQDLNNEIKLLKAQGADIEKIREKEMELALERAKNAKANILANQNEIKYLEGQKRLSKEQKARLEELKDATNELSLAYSDATANINILAASQKTEREKESDERDKQAAKDEQAEKDRNKKLQADKLAAQKKFDQDRLVAERLTESLRLELLEDGVEKEIAISNNKYNILIEDTIKNENLTQKEKDEIIKRYQDIQISREDEIREAKRLKDEEDKAIEEQRLIDEEDAKKEHNAKLQQELIDYNNSLVEGELEKQFLNQELQYQAELEQLEYFLNEGLITREDYNKRILDAEKRNSDARLKIEKDEANAKKAIMKAQIDFSISATGDLLSSMQGMVEEGSKAAKGLAIAQVTIQAIQGGIAAVTQAIAQLGPIAGPIVGGVLAAGIAVSSVAAINKIKNTKADSKGGGGGVTNISAAMPNVGSTSPNINLYGNANETGGDGSQFDSVNRGDEEQPMIKAVVSWNDIDAVSKSDTRLRNQMAL